MAKDMQNKNIKDDIMIMKLYKIITKRNLIGLIGVVPILFNKLEFLNSKIDWGTKINDIVKIGIISPVGIIYPGPNIIPRKNTNIGGTIKAKTGPIIPFQKYLFINLNNVSILSSSIHYKSFLFFIFSSIIIPILHIDNLSSWFFW